MQRPFRDWGGNLVAFAIVILLNFLSNALPINGQTMPEISAKYPSLFTPAGFTFAIWGVIYLGLLVFVIWQAFPAQRSSDKVARLSIWFQINCLMNAVWIVLWHYDLLALSLLVMFVILATLILIYRTLIADIDTASFTEHLVLHLPFSLYTGWITLATIANASVLQTSNGWDYVWLTAVQWTLLKLAVAGAIGARMVLQVPRPRFRGSCHLGGLRYFRNAVRNSLGFRSRTDSVTVDGTAGRDRIRNPPYRNSEEEELRWPTRATTSRLKNSAMRPATCIAPFRP